MIVLKLYGWEEETVKRGIWHRGYPRHREREMVVSGHSKLDIT